MAEPVSAPLGLTPSQTVGPYFSMMIARVDEDAVMATTDTDGELVTVTGRVLAGDGSHVEDLLVEVWQANRHGRYHHPDDDRDDVPLTEGFTGFGRAKGRFSDGAWMVQTIRPGRVPHPSGGLQAPHLNLTIMARGMLNPSFTRLYLGDEEEANAADPVLQQVPADRRHTMIAARGDGEDGTPTFTLDIVMQGDAETVFLDW